MMVMLQEKSQEELLVDREPETRSLIRWILENPFVSSINFHDGSVVVKLPKCFISNDINFARICILVFLISIHNWLIYILLFFSFKIYKLCATFKTVVEMCYFQKRKNVQ